MSKIIPGSARLSRKSSSYDKQNNSLGPKPRIRVIQDEKMRKGSVNVQDNDSSWRAALSKATVIW